MRILLFVLLLVLGGCASTVQPPVANNYSNLTTTPAIKLDAPVAEFPKAQTVTENGVEYVAFTVEDSDKILAYRQNTKNTRDALNNLVLAHNETISERNLLVRALQLEESRGNMLAQQYAEAENGRRHEQTTRIIETSIYKTLLVIIGVAAAM